MWGFIYLSKKFLPIHIIQSIMKNINLPIELIYLKKAIKNKEITVDYIVKSTGIDQSQISKILNNKAKIRSKNFSILCKFALNNCYIDPEILKGHTVNYIQNLSATNNKLLLLAVYDIVSSSMDI